MTNTTETHGTPSAYFNGCTAGPGGKACAKCKAAGAAYREDGTYAAFMAGKTTKPPLFYPGDRTRAYDESDVRHGGLSAYTAGCRCPWCCLAGSAYRSHKKLGLKLPRGWNARYPETQE